MNFISNTAVFTLILCIIMPISAAYGHGLGLDIIPSINVDGKKITLTVEIPMNFNSDEKQITITATKDKTNENTKNTTFLIRMFYENKTILSDYFFAEQGVLDINVKTTSAKEIEILGQQDGTLNAWYAPQDQSLEIIGPIFQTGGLYTFEIDIVTIDDSTNIIKNPITNRADLSVVEIREFNQQVQENNIKFRIKSYFDKISNFVYDPDAKTITFEMPFDWSKKTISHIPVIHAEVHFPKDFIEYVSPGYVGTINGIELFKSSVIIDDYTEDDERIVHFVLLDDNLQLLDNQLRESGEQLPKNMVFSLALSDKNLFPLTSYTNNKEFSVDLSWDPQEIMPKDNTLFIFTIRDTTTGQPLRQSSYDFVILQDNQEIYRVHSNAPIGGSFEKFTFSEEQTGSTIIKFENIRGTGAETEFRFVVVPEFGNIVLLIFVTSMICAILINTKFAGIPKT